MRGFAGKEKGPARVDRSSHHWLMPSSGTLSLRTLRMLYRLDRVERHLAAHPSHPSDPPGHLRQHPNCFRHAARLKRASSVRSRSFGSSSG